MFKASVGKENFEILPNENGFIVNGKPFAWDLVTINEQYFHILHEKKSYVAEVVALDITAKTFTIKINNHIHTVFLKDKFDLLLEKMGMTGTQSGKANSVKAPMPGLIIDLKVKEGDLVKPQDPLLILEAMKMENIIKAVGEGTVKSIKIKKGDSVEKNQLLIEF